VIGTELSWTFKCYSRTMAVIVYFFMAAVNGHELLP